MKEEDIDIIEPEVTEETTEEQETQELLDAADNSQAQEDTADNKAEQGENRLWGSLFTEGESEEHDDHSLRETLQHFSIDSRWVFRQLPLLAIITIGFLLLVTNRYGAQQDLIEKSNLEKELEDWKYRTITRNAELTRLTRQSQIEEMLKARGDSTLIHSNETPFRIIKEK